MPSQNPIRVDISQSGKGRPAPARATPATTPLSIPEIVGEAARRVFPATNQQRVAVSNDIADAARKGDIARASGAVARGMVMYPAAVAADTLVRPGLAALGAVPRFLGGLFGSKGDTTVTKAPPADKPATDPATGVDAVRASLAAAQKGPNDFITPYDRQLAFLDSVFQQPLTMREAQAYSGMLPARDIKTPTHKDEVIGTAANAIDAQYKIDLDAASKLGAQAEIDAARVKATDEYRKRYAALAGVNPLQNALADMTAEQQGAQ